MIVPRSSRPQGSLVLQQQHPKLKEALQPRCRLRGGRGLAREHQQDRGARPRQGQERPPAVAALSRVSVRLVPGCSQPAGRRRGRCLPGCPAPTEPPPVPVQWAPRYLSKTTRKVFLFQPFSSRCSVPVHTNIWASFQKQILFKNIQLSIFQRNY